MQVRFGGNIVTADLTGQECRSAPAIRALNHLGDQVEVRASGAGGVSVSLSIATWVALGQVPVHSAPPEEVEAWISTHEHVARLFGVRRQAVAIDAEGHVGGERMRFVARVDGFDLRDAPSPVLPDGHVALPIPFAVARRVADFHPPSTRERQLAFLATLRDDIEFTVQALDGSAVPVDFAFGDHLKRFQFRRVERVALAWRPSAPNAKTLDLQVDILSADGSRETLDVSTVDSNESIASTSAFEHFLLPDDVATVARIAKDQRNRLPGRVQHLIGDPRALLPEGVAYDSVDLSEYSPRVLGFAPIIRADRLADIQVSGVEWYRRDADPTAPVLRLAIARPDGSRAELTFPTREHAEQTLRELEAAAPAAIVQIGDTPVAATDALTARLREGIGLVRALDAKAENAQKAQSAQDEETPAPGGKRLAAQIRETSTATAVQLAEPFNDRDVPWDELERRLQPGIQLRSHQRTGIAWLWHHYKHEHPGVLLADEMGVGKTLQISSFLALLRASGRTHDKVRPSLIVAPVVLLHVWEKELRKFFRPGTFDDVISLHGKGLAAFVRNGALNRHAIERHEIIVTNYDTLAAHQPQLLKIDWASVVLDEAQHIKNPDTYRSLAARGLKRSFGICATGTPVENSLLDVWSLFEFLSPGRPFGARKDFERRFTPDSVDGLRKTLGLPDPRALVMRRTTAEALPDLPEKHVHIELLAMTDEQAETERILVQRNKHQLGVLQDLQKLYQHPLLLRRGSDIEQSTSALIGQSPKLGWVVERLREIQSRNEKAIVFTLWTAMQNLLQHVLQEELGLSHVGIVNGQANQRGTASRELDHFADASGFAAMILSPLAAGTGLTITAANHVLHYGRWWNPAKEDQATGRAYRIGQQRDVHVYYPLLHHPSDREQGFDVKLHELVERKRLLARDFLQPASSLDVQSGELSALSLEGP